MGPPILHVYPRIGGTRTLARSSRCEVFRRYLPKSVIQDWVKDHTALPPEDHKK